MAREIEALDPGVKKQKGPAPSWSSQLVVIMAVSAGMRNIKTVQDYPLDYPLWSQTGATTRRLRNLATGACLDSGNTFSTEGPKVGVRLRRQLPESPKRPVEVTDSSCSYQRKAQISPLAVLATVCANLPLFVHLPCFHELLP